ncbi:MAG: GNAT family N-acetyltransferase [Alicyclobacillus macrosporangiidus]|uniref:GNAT family N-acetyltransferase n=1 Tax=Alicyclobacillus macrosporangiidus TaxID=392015 RepID=UPI0026F0A25E|nr:GNAT family N-acetyltransferase [Alicyclobacillus macrosporangiidus]MCL6599905.1 GNAT family N-acetyltransferase [Alicyclobacillus macrosporangiidus]
MDLTIKPLTPALVDDYLRFFDHDAFPKGNEWAGCYCYYYHCCVTHSEWAGRSGDMNRRSVTELILRGQHHGLLAYHANRVVGWCHAAPRHTLPRLVKMLNALDETDTTVASIVCFLVAPPYRGSGIARRLLISCCEFMSNQGMTLLEAYPPKGNPQTAHYHGSQSMYLQAGFTPVAELEHYVVVQKPLRMSSL